MQVYQAATMWLLSQIDIHSCFQCVFVVSFCQVVCFHVPFCQILVERTLSDKRLLQHRHCAESIMVCGCKSATSTEGIVREKVFHFEADMVNRSREQMHSTHGTVISDGYINVSSDYEWKFLRLMWLQHERISIPISLPLFVCILSMFVTFVPEISTTTTEFNEQANQLELDIPKRIIRTR